MSYGRVKFESLSSKRLILRKPVPDDAREIFNLRSNEEVNQYLGREAATSIEDAVTFIEKILAVINKNEGCYWAICLKENPRAVGTICYFDFSSDQTTAEIGYELHPVYQHKGIMQEALTTVLHYGFQGLQLKSIVAFPSADNAPSIRLLERNGFKREDDGLEREGNLVRYILRALAVGIPSVVLDSAVDRR
jgi:ribosomal-protein-alanine N-acetyltransferase